VLFEIVCENWFDEVRGRKVEFLIVNVGRGGGGGGLLQFEIGGLFDDKWTS